MKKIIDANYLQDPALEIYLNSDIRNKVVFHEYACMETVKGNAVKNLSQSIAIVSRYPKQVIVLKTTRAICQLKPSSRGLQKRFECRTQTSKFNVLCQNVKQADDGDEEMLHRILDGAKVVTDHFELIRKETAAYAEAIKYLRHKFQINQYPRFRKGAKLPNDIIEKMIEDIFKITATAFRTLSHLKVPPITELHNGYVFRNAICSYLLALKWMTDGGINNAKEDTFLNDLIDMHYAAYATFFDGLLTKDKKLKTIYLDTCFILKEFIEPIMKEALKPNRLELK